MSARVDTVVGLALAGLAEFRLRQLGPGEMLRIRRNEDGVILALVEALSSFDFDGTSDPVTIGVSATAESMPDLPARFLLPADMTEVTLRNSAGVSLVLVDRDGTSGAQSLAQLPTIEDGDILSSGGETRLDVVGLAWEACGGAGGRPEALAKFVAEILDVVSVDRDVAVRQWVEFCVSCCARLVGQARDENEIGRAVGSSLTRLGLFRDESLFAPERKGKRAQRLTRNLNFSQDLDARGRSIVADDIALVADHVDFCDEDGEDFDEDEQSRLRREVKERLYRLAGAEPPELDLFVWDQLFEKAVSSKGLGTQVREHIRTTAPTRVEEFDVLSVSSGLDARDAESARTLISAEPESEGTPLLIEELSKSLKRRVERLAEPRTSSVIDPLRHLVRELYRVVEETPETSGETPTVRVRHIRLGSAPPDDKSLSLFRLIYGPTLYQAFSDTSSALRLQVVLDDAFIGPPAAPSQTGEAGDGSDPTEGWGPVHLSLELEGDSGELHRFRWEPLEHTGLIGLQALLHQPDCAAWDTGGVTFDEWCRDSLVGPLVGAKHLVPYRSDTVTVREWLELRDVAFSTLRDGIRADTLNDYVTAWSALLKELKDAHSEHGFSLLEVDAFLGIDTVECGDGFHTVLATHPLRLRWLARHLEETARQLTSICDGDLRLNSVNDGLYFDLLDQLSPHEQPPILTRDGQIFLAVREEDGHEHFARLRDGRGNTHHEWLSDLDDASIDVLASAVRRYVDAHPQKRDGVSLLLMVRGGGARVVRRLLEKGVREKGRLLPTTLHLVAPRSEFAALEAALSVFDDAEERLTSDLPSLQTVLHPWGDGDLPNIEQLSEQVDIAVVPNLFGAATSARDKSRPRGSSHGAFDPWRGATSFIDPQSTQEQGAPSVSRVLLPDQPAPVLWDWSTLCVREARNEAVTDELTAIDYVTMQVRFDQGAPMFERLHELAHWVVTLDAFIGRAQIERLESGPDVILMQPRVGKNQAYTLLVSSMSGRHFVESRLRARIEADFPDAPTAEAAQLPAVLYDRGRSLFPGLVLRCLGLGWAVQELTGLVVTHRLVEVRKPIEDKEGFSAWISLDEQTRWFGAAQSRADLARITAQRVDGRLIVDVLVIESKFRESEDVSAADSQVTNSLALLGDALAPEDGEPAADSHFWRRQILDVAEQSSRRQALNGGAAAFQCWSADGGLGVRLSEEVRNSWLDGDFELRSVDGLVCTMSTALSGPLSGVSVTPAGHEWYRLGPEDIWKTLRALYVDPDPGPDPDIRDDGGAAEPLGSTSGSDTKREEEKRDEDDPETTDEIHPETGEAKEKAGRKSHEEMEALYQKVLDVFSEFKIRVGRPDVDAYKEGPGFYKFRVIPGPGVKPDAVSKLAPELKLKLGLERDFNPGSYIDGGAVVFEVPKSDADRYFIEAESLWARTPPEHSRLFAPIGEDINGDVVGVDFSSSDSPHLLIAGLTGSGKSVALETLLKGLCRAHTETALRLGLVDPKGTELNDFEDDPRLLGLIGMDARDAIDLLELGVNEMENRRSAFRSVRARNLPEHNAKVAAEDRLPWWLIVLDEYADLTSDKDDRKKIEHYLQRLSQKARASGIHVVVATQKPSAEVISTTVRSNLPAQLALRVKTASDSRVILDEAGAESLAGKGDALLKTARRTVRLQCAEIRRE
jgi:DNA segregation ATPase FtsK/SpoIIIE, S-DNA-T family